MTDKRNVHSGRLSQRFLLLGLQLTGGDQLFPIGEPLSHTYLVPMCEDADDEPAHPHEDARDDGKNVHASS